MKIIRRFKAFVRLQLSKRKLKKSGYDNWREYKHARDKDIRPYASFIEHFYIGYTYVHPIKDYKHYAYQQIADYGPGGTWYGYNEIAKWCSEKIRWDYRIDFHRVSEICPGLTEFDEMGGGDLIYFAFKNEKDYMLFLLRWS